MPYAKEDLKSLFASPFNAKEWTAVLADLFGVKEDAEGRLLKPQPIPRPFPDAKGWYLGAFTTSDGYLVGLFVFEAKSVQRRRVGLRNLLKPMLGANHDAALAVFTERGSDAWRFSFVCDLKNEGTAAKRFTYVFGDPSAPCRTPVQRFLALRDAREPGLPVSLAAMRDAFSVEALSDEFFAAYKEHYETFVAHITGKRFVKQGGKWVETETGRPNRALYRTFDRDDKRVRDYVKKMLGRLVFLHFLQKKGWLGACGGSWTGGDPAFLLHLFEKATPAQQADFLDGVLEKLFFNALNTDRSAQGDLFDTGVRGIGKCRIPYLNGGLFEKDELDALRVLFPAEFFRDLLGFFAEYNFTIDENDADEAEVGIDPEMLGRIFENLLEDNKDKGAFYTPKEIVRYMCRQSLLAHLAEDEAQSDADAIAAFLDTRDPAPLPKPLAARLADKLRDVKICDPAIGSGAFPMGLLRELFDLRTALEPAATGLKRQIIENNIYGVDIEKGAVDIARLRFWLALVVDADEPTPLPNLDFKIMQGNSLVEAWKGHDLSTLTGVARTKRLPAQTLPGFEAPAMQLTFFDMAASAQRVKLRSLLHQWFACANHVERKQLHIDILTTVRNVFHEQGSDVSLEDIDPSSNPFFFLWHLWFAEVFDSGGFDILIGNPPYIQLQNNRGELANLYASCQFDTYSRSGDIYCLFYERGWQLLKNKGHLCFITSNKWMRAGYGEKLRGFFSERTNPKILIDFAGEKIFESATVDTNILLFQKGAHNTGKTLAAIGSPECRNNLSGFVRQQGFPCAFFSTGSWVILSPIEQSIKAKIEAIGIPLKDWDVSINYGIKTGCNEAFIIDAEQRREILSWCKTTAEKRKTAELIRPILRGRDIKRYGYDWANLYILALFPARHYDIENYPAIKRHLLSFAADALIAGGREDLAREPHLTNFCRAKLEQTGRPIRIGGKPVILRKRDGSNEEQKARKRTANKWFEVQDTIAYWDDFLKPKIVWGNLCLHSSFAKAPEGMFANAPSPMIVPYSDFVLAILNSKLGDWYIRQLGVTRNGGYFEYKPMFVENLPIPKLSQVQQQEFLHSLPKGNQQLDAQEEIDSLVFKLYGLTKDEEAFVRGNG